jgi:CHASE2 domain-containing sensor protein
MSRGGPHVEVQHRARPFSRHLLAAAPVLLLVTGITTLLSQRGLLAGFESAALDVWLGARAPRAVDDVVLVTIDDEDYRALFHRKSPLEPATVIRLVEAVAAGRPRAVGVDLDTSDEAYAGYSPPPGVVWAREGILDEEAAAAGAGGHHGGDHGSSVAFRAGPVLGRDGEAAAKIAGGLALMPQDRDGIIRRYRHELPLAPSAEGGHAAPAPGKMATLGWAVLRAADERAGRPPRPASEHALVLNFAGDRYAFPHIAARDVLAAANSAAWGEAGPLKDRVVLVGGTFRAARDEYVTPVGAMPGMQLVAQAIESELHSGGIRPLAHWLMTLLEIASGILLVWINYRFRLGAALALSLGAMPLLTLLGSALAFSSLAYWFDFAPTLLGVWIHELIDHAREYRAMHEALHGARAAGAVPVAAAVTAESPSAKESA